MTGRPQTTEREVVHLRLGVLNVDVAALAVQEGERLKSALSEARRAMHNAWGAVTSGQIVDKGVADMLCRGIEAADAALRPKETTDDA